MPKKKKKIHEVPGRRVLLLMVDGARPETIREMMAKGELPAISRHLTSVSGTAVTAYPSVTGPTFAPMLTGCFPGTCNLPGVRWFDRHLPDSPRYRHRRFRNYFGKGVYLMDHDLSPKVRTVFELVPRSYNVLGVLNRGTGIRRDLGFFLVPYFYLQSRREGGMKRVEQGAHRLFMKALEKDPQFLFYYFPTIDALSHQWGVDHPEVRAAYRRLDAIFESIVGLLLFHGIWEETLVLLTGDHGMSDVTGAFDTDGFLEKSLNTCYLPKGFKGWKEAEAISMPSGNAMVNLYLRLDRTWRRFAYFEEIEEKKRPLLMNLLERPEVLLLAGRSLEGGVRVWTKKGRARIGEGAGGVMTYEPEGGDPFGYTDFPRRFNCKDSLEKTCKTSFPDAPLQILQFFRSPRAGDLLLAAAPGFELRNPSYERPVHRATHGSFFPEHMEIPLFANRPLPPGPLRSIEIFRMIMEYLGLDCPHETDL